MIKVDVVYNPYFVRTHICINGKSAEAGSELFELCRGRLQDWVDRFFQKVKEVTRGREFAFSFRGMVQDADDFADAMKIFLADEKNSDVKCSLVTESTGRRSERVTDLKKLLESGQVGPFASIFKSKEMEDAINRATDPTFEANVIATMSSGKSTVVNSLLGLDLMPSKNEACTATIARITDKDGAKDFVAQRFNKDNEPISSIVKVDNKTLVEWNDDPDTSLIEIVGDIPTVNQTDDCQMVFVDTPGPNNSQDPSHQRATYEAIQEKPLSMVLYVLNLTVSGVNDDLTLLKKVCEVMSAGGRQAQDRFVFIANKIDAYDPERGDSVTACLKNVRNYLKGVGIENPFVIPTSALLAKLIRMKRAGYQLTRAERGDLAKFVDLFVNEKEMDLVEHVKDRISADCYRRLRKRIESAATDEDKAEILSGIPIVEELLNDFLQKHALPAKLKDAVDSLGRVWKAANLAEKQEAELKKGESERDELLKSIRAFNSDKENVERGKKFRKEIEEFKYTRSSAAKKALIDIVTKLDAVCDELEEKIGDGKALPEEARRLTIQAVSRCKELDADVISSLQSALQREQLDTLTTLRERYRKYVEDTLKRAFPKGSGAAALQAAAMEMPSVASMIADNICTERVVSGTHRECIGSHRERCGSHREWFSSWNPFKLFSREVIDYRTVKDYKTVTDYKNVEKVNLAEIAKKVIAEIRKVTLNNIEAFKKRAADVVVATRKQVLDVMSEIDDRVRAIQSDLERANASKAELEAQIRDCESKVKWIKAFNKKLNGILEV